MVETDDIDDIKQQKRGRVECPLCSSMSEFLSFEVTSLLSVKYALDSMQNRCVFFNQETSI